MLCVYDASVKARTSILLAVVAATAGALFVFAERSGAEAPELPSKETSVSSDGASAPAPATSGTGAAKAAAAAAALSGPMTDAHAPATKSGDETTTVKADVTWKQDVNKALDEWGELFKPRAQITEEETRELMTKRKAEADAIAASIGAGDAKSLAAVRDAIGQTDVSREKILLIHGLGESLHPESVSALTDVYDSEPIFRVREEVLRRLANSKAPGHIDLLVRELFEAKDVRIQMLAAQGLYGEEAALPDLIRALRSDDLPIEVRLEVVHSIGGVKTEAAAEALRALVSDPNTLPRLRVFAEKELERMAR